MPVQAKDIDCDDPPGRGCPSLVSSAQLHDPTNVTFVSTADLLRGFHH
jgi:hypothetical protein